MTIHLKDFIHYVTELNQNQPEFIQSVSNFSEDVIPFINEQYPNFEKLKILERLIEPERIIIFKITWMDDLNNIQINRGYRVQMSSIIGPYKGGLRFSPTVNLSVLKFLAFEQIFKNDLTGISLGAAKGGSDFNPKNKTDNEIMRFCQSFMNELYRHIGSQTDIPAGDMGVGQREIGYLFGQYKKLRNQFSGVITGKGKAWGGSNIRPEATGYGLLYFVELIYKEQNSTLKNKIITISGAGNVAYYAAEKAIQLGAKVVSLSNSKGTLYDPEGLDSNKLKRIAALGKDIDEFPLHYSSAQFLTKQKPWSIPCDIALPCATENEITEKDALNLVANGCKCVAEGANMPSTREAFKVFINAGINYAPGKAANAGGVVVSGLEMSQNATGLRWTNDNVDDKLKGIMESIYKTCTKYGTEKGGYINYLKGANIGGFIKVAQAMQAQGIV